MAVAVDATGTADRVFNDSVSPQTFTNLTVGASATCLWAAFCETKGVAITSPAATWNGVAMTLLKSQATTDNHSVHLFGLLNPVSGNQTLSFSWSAASNIDGYLDAISFTGSDTSSIANCFRNATGASFAAAAASPFTLAVTLNSSGDIAVGACAAAADAFSSCGPTEIFRDNTGFIGNGCAARGTGTSSVTLTASAPTAGTKAWAGVDIAAAAAGGALQGAQMFCLP